MKLSIHGFCCVRLIFKGQSLVFNSNAQSILSYAKLDQSSLIFTLAPALHNLYVKYNNLLIVRF